MKLKYIYLALTTLLFLSCTDDVETINESTVNEAKNNVYKIDGLELNNGKKWEANQETTDGVNKMLKVVSAINDNSSLKDYHKVAKKLDKIKGKIINKCSMEGKSHDNLHLWLMPLIKKINGLKESDDVVSAEKIFNRIKDNLNIYTEFFE